MRGIPFTQDVQAAPERRFRPLSIQFPNALMSSSGRHEIRVIPYGNPRSKGFPAVAGLFKVRPSAAAGPDHDANLLERPARRASALSRTIPEERNTCPEKREQ